MLYESTALLCFSVCVADTGHCQMDDCHQHMKEEADQEQLQVALKNWIVQEHGRTPTALPLGQGLWEQILVDLLVTYIHTGNNATSGTSSGCPGINTGTNTPVPTVNSEMQSKLKDL